MVAICDWCLQEARVQTIDEKLWRFWKIISTEDPNVTSHRNICDKCKSRYEGFSIYIENCKNNTFIIDELLSMGQVQDEPPFDIEYPLLIKTEISNDVDLKSFRPTVSSGVFIEGQMLAGCSNSPMKSDDSTIDEVLSAGKVKKEPLDDLINEEDVWKKEEVSVPDYPTVSGGKGKDRLGGEPFKCSHCYKSFTLLGKLNVHLRTHTGEKRFKCSHCNKSFLESSKLNVHLRIHTGEKPFKCSYCNKSFTQVNSLNVHLRTHTGEKPFKCSHCNKSFAHSNSLKDHLRIHTGEKLFKCSHCNKSFTHPNSLKDHLRIHTGEKPFSCSHCNKSFTQLNSLNVHLRTHTGEKPFKCSHCDRSFTQVNHLNVHLRTHTSEKPFTCSHCNKSFAHSNSLKRHSRIHTKDK